MLTIDRDFAKKPMSVGVRSPWSTAEVRLPTQPIGRENHTAHRWRAQSIPHIAVLQEPGFGRSETEPSGPRYNRPALDKAAVCDDVSLLVERRGRADVVRHAVETIPDAIAPGFRALDHQMLLIVR